MAEPVKIGDAMLYLGDCREILPTIPPDAAIISDPPYGIGYVRGGGGLCGSTGKLSSILALRERKAAEGHQRPIVGDDGPFDPSHLFSFPKVLIFGADHFRARLPEGGTFIAWDKSCGIGPDDSFADAEYAWANFKVKRNVIRFLWKGVVSIKTGEENGYRYHPTQKPVGLMKRCIELAGLPEIVADPYMGGGSTGVAAAQMGLKFIGCEIDPKHFATACERIERAYAQQRLFA